MARFQVELSGKWHDYEGDEDKILKRAFQAGFPNARFALRGQHYEYDFKTMEQKNTDTGKTRRIRAPHKWKQPSEPLVPKGRTTTVTVPKGPDGKAPATIQLPHPDLKGATFTVNVPPTARPGQVLLVPIPDLPPGAQVDAPEPAAAPPAGAPPATGKSGGLSTGAKVAMGLGGAAVVGAGALVGGVALGAAVGEDGLAAAGDTIEDGAITAAHAIEGAAVSGAHAVEGVALTVGDHIGDVATDAEHWISGAATDAGDFIMDLF